MKIDFDLPNIEPSTPPAMGLNENTVTQLKIGFFAVVILGCFGFGIAQAFSPQSRQIRQETQQQEKLHSRDLTLQQQQQRHGQQSREIAEQAYSEGCLLVQMQDGSGNIISLTEGMSVVDSQTNQPLAAGTTVCDPNGAVSTLGAGGVVQTIAITPDLELVNQAIQEGRAR